MKRLMILNIAFLLLAAPTFSEGQSRDYSAGFEQLFLLGLPDVTDAEYVNLSIQGQEPGGIYDHNWKRINLTGNAWRLEAPDEHRTIYLYGEGQTVEVYDARYLRELRREEAEERDDDTPPVHVHWGHADGRYGGKEKPADLEADIEKLLEHLGANEDDGSEGLQKYQFDRISGRIFIFAALAHRKGLSDQASALVDALFARAEDPREIILRGIDHLADQQYEDIFAEWEQDDDWSAYHERLTALLERFRVGWHMAPAVERLRTLVEFRMNQPEPPDVDGLSEEDQTLADMLAEAESPPRYRQHGFWIFPESGAPTRAAAWMQATTNHVLQLIKERGRDSIPLLLALLDDEYLTSMTLNRVSGVSMGQPTRRQGELDDAQLQRMFDSLKRPALRSDVARVLLAIVVQEEEHTNYSRLSIEELRIAVEDWLDRFDEMSLVEVARTYLLEGTPDQRTAAGLHLLLSQDEEQIRYVEEIIRDAADPVDIAQVVLLYSRVRGTDSHELVKEYIEELRVSLEHLDGRRAWQKQQYQRVLSQLEDVVSGKTVENYLESVLAGEETLSLATLSRLAGREPIRRVVDTLLTTAAETDDAQLRGDLATALLYHELWGQSQFAMPMDVDLPVAEEAGPWMVDDFADQWAVLLDDERPSAGTGMSMIAPVNLRAAQAMFILQVDQETIHRYWQYMSRAGSHSYPPLIAWAKARLHDENTPSPEPPSETDVDEERLTELRATLMETETDEIPARLDSFTPAEILALYDIMEDDVALARHLVPVANRISAVRAFDPDEVDDALNARLKGQSLGPDLVEIIIEALREKAAEGRPIMFTVYRGLALDGVHVQYGLQQKGMQMYELETPRDKEPHITGYLHAPGISPVPVRWPLDGKTDEPETEDEPMGLLDEMLVELDERMDHATEKGREDFWNGLEKLTTADISPLRHGAIVLRAVLPPSPDDVEEELEEEEEAMPDAETDATAPDEE